MASIFSGKKLAVTLGGNAAERSISLESGGNVAQILEQSGASVLRLIPLRPVGWSNWQRHLLSSICCTGRVERMEPYRGCSNG